MVRHHARPGGEWMIGKFATVSALTLLLTILVLTNLLAGRAFAQTPPADQPPATPPAASAPPAQQPSNGEEPADEASISRRKKRPHEYKNWVYNVGAGAQVDSGATKTFVRGGGVTGSIGVARNANKYLGLRGDFIFADLPLRDSSLSLAQASSATSYALAATVDPIINLPVSKLYSGYVLFGPAYYHRTGSLNSDTTVPGGACSRFWEWWGACQNFSVPLNGSFTSSSLNQFGYNIGAGVTRKMPSGVEIYAEYRFMHGSGDHTTTDIRPITIGVRW
jgi:opacity protein-like surface antigen